MDWDKAFDEFALETSKRNDAVDPVLIALKSASEHERGIRLGWHDEDGNSLLEDEEDEEDDL